VFPYRFAAIRDSPAPVPPVWAVKPVFDRDPQNACDQAGLKITTEDRAVE